MLASTTMLILGGVYTIFSSALLLSFQSIGLFEKVFIDATVLVSVGWILCG